MECNGVKQIATRMKTNTHATTHVTNNYMQISLKCGIHQSEPSKQRYLHANAKTLLRPVSTISNDKTTHCNAKKSVIADMWLGAYGKREWSVMQRSFGGSYTR